MAGGPQTFSHLPFYTMVYLINSSSSLNNLISYRSMSKVLQEQQFLLKTSLWKTAFQYMMYDYEY